MAPRSVWSHPLLRAGLGLALLGVCAAITARLALDQRGSDRCPTGLSAVGARCCGEHQRLVGQACRGTAAACAATQEAGAHGACVARFGVVSIPGGDLFIGAADWDGATGGERFPRTAVQAFRLDLNEVTWQRFGDCRSCAELATRRSASDEPGLPVTNISPEAAATFCQREGGRLPTSAEWVWAAAGAQARRYPWGNSGLVCRRAAFGLEAGPCADAGSGPDLAGSRPDGATPEGVLDLAGNVAEWTREPDGSFAARGGSFRSRSAAELKSWAAAAGPQKALHIGFRCAYPP